MKVSLGIFWILVFITVFAQLGSSKIVSKREESNYENGTDVVVVKPGLLDIVLTEKNLTFKFCDNNCNEDFLVCYEPISANQTAYLDLCDSTCGFYVNANAKEFSFMHTIADSAMWHYKTDKCYEAYMMYDLTIVNGDDDILNSCDPKIENGIVTLNITTASSGCPMTIKNAKLYKAAEVSAPNPTSNENSPSNNNPENVTPSDSSATTSKIIGNYFGWFLVLFASFYLLQ